MSDASWDELLASLGLTPSAEPHSSRAACDCTGDRSAYQKHIRLGEEPCPESRAANSTYVRSRAGGKERQRPDCGTYPGYQGHVKRGEPIDARCAEARRERDRAHYAARKQAA